MRKFIQESITERLKHLTIIDNKYVVDDSNPLPEDHIPAIKHFDLWNSNVVLQQSQTFEMPAVFIEFQPIEWKHLSQGVRESDMHVILHVITQSLSPEADYIENSLNVFDLLTAINICLHGHTNTSNRFEHNPITSYQSQTDHNFENLRNDSEIFNLHAIDASCFPVYQNLQPELNMKIEFMKQ